MFYLYIFREVMILLLKEKLCDYNIRLKVQHTYLQRFDIHLK